MRIHFTSPIIQLMSATATIATLLLAPSTARAVVVDLLPSDIHLDDTNTASFSDAFLTLTPFRGALESLTQTTFNAQPARLGVDDVGTSNNNAFNDPDIDPNNGNEERLQFEFASTAALTRIAYDFARADGPGPDDGVIITGFMSDPQVNFTFEGDPVNNVNLFAEYDGAGRLRLNIPGALFNGNDIDINFTNPAASQGQTLLLSATDTTQAGAQFPITGISYDDDPPLFGDVDGDGSVTITDFGFIRDNFYDEGVTREMGDLTGDDIVDIEDFDQWKTAFGPGAAAFASQLFSATPEPSSLLLIALGGFFLSNRRQSNR